MRSTTPRILRFASATWSTTAPSLSSPTGFCVNCHSASNIRNSNESTAKDNHRVAPCQMCHAAVPHGTVRAGLIALTTDPAPYNRGASRVAVVHRGLGSDSNYSKSNCSTTSGCH